MSIRIGILGYGNLGRGVECAIKHNPDLELVAVFTRRNPEDVSRAERQENSYRTDSALPDLRKADEDESSRRRYFRSGFGLV